MKKGCFLTSVILFTLIVGAAVYFYKFKKDFLKSFSKSKIMDMAVADFDKKIDEMAKSPYKDSLKAQLHQFFVTDKKLDFDTAMARMQSVVTRANEIINDKIIDSAEYNNFKNYLKRYEGSEKNRN